MMVHMFFFFNDTATTEIYTLPTRRSSDLASAGSGNLCPLDGLGSADDLAEPGIGDVPVPPGDVADRKSTRLNSSHANIPYAVFCLNKKIISRPPYHWLNSASIGRMVGHRG